MRPLRWLASGVVLVNFRRRYVSAQFWDPRGPETGTLRSPHTHARTRTRTNTCTQRRGHPFAVGARSKWYLFSLGAVPPLCIMPSPSFCLWDFAPPNYLALLLALSFDRCRKLVLSFSLASWFLSFADFLCSYHFLLFSMAKPKSAKGFFDRARARGSEKNKDSVNGEEVKKELMDATKRNYRQALALWDQ